MRKLNEPNFEGLSDKDRATVVEMVKKGANRREVMAWMMAAGATAAAAGGGFDGLAFTGATPELVAASLPRPLLAPPGRVAASTRAVSAAVASGEPSPKGWAVTSEAAGM